MLRGEYESMKAIYAITPDFIPAPPAYGRYKTKSPIAYFYLSDFVNMDVKTAADPVELAAKLSTLHKNSKSPTGNFGFHVVTCDGRMPHVVEWEESWAVFYGKLLRNITNIDLQTNGPWPEMQRATDQVI